MLNKIGNISLLFFLAAGSFTLLPPYVHASDDNWKLTVSGELAVVLTYAEENAEIERKVEVKPQTRVECGGGGLVGAMDCVTKRIEGAAEDGGEEYETVVEKASLRAELNGTVTPVIEVIEEGRLYRVKLDLSNMQAPTKLTGPFDDKRKKEIVRDEIHVKKALRSWRRDIGPEKLEELKNREDKTEVYFFSDAFSGLARLQQRRPKEPKVEVYYSSSDCFDLEAEFYKSQQDYLELMATVPLSQQFEVLTRSMAEIEHALTLTAEGLRDVEGEMDKVYEESPAEEKIGEYIKEAEGLSDRLTEALEGIKATIKEEREAILKAAEKYSKPIEEVKKGIGKSAETMEEVSGTVKNINKYLDIAKNAISAENMSGADTLRTFSKYFSSITEELGPLVESIPVLGVFLDLYARAIEQIAESVEKIEKVMHNQNRIARRLRETGDPWMTPDPYKFTNTAQERIKRERQKLFNRTETLKNRLIRECHVNVPWSEEYGDIDAIEDAGAEAEEACKGLKVDYKKRESIERAFKKAKSDYYAIRGELIKTGIKNNEEARKRIKIYREVKAFHEDISRWPRPQIRQRNKMIKSLDSLVKLRSLTDAERGIWIALKTGENPQIKDIQTIGKENERRKKEIITWKNKRDEIKAVRERLKKAQGDYDSVRGNNQKYRECKMNHLRRLAHDKGWRIKTVEAIHFDLFRSK